MKNINLGLLFLIVISGPLLFAQPGFNIVKDLGLPTNHFRDMLVDNDTIVGYGLAYDTVSQLQGLLLAKFDSSGNFISSNLILDPSDDFLGISKSWGKMVKAPDGGYAMTAAPLISNSAYLIKVNHALEVEFIKEYPDTVNLSNYNYRLLAMNDGYLLFGSLQRPNFQDDSFIRRVDKQGNTIWFKIYGNYDVSDAMLDVKLIDDSTFITGSVDNVGSNIFGSSRTTIRFIDWHGDILQTWQSEPDPDIGYIRKILPTEDGGFITYGQFLIEQIGQTYKVVQSTLAKFDEDFHIEWLRHFGTEASLSVDVQLWDIEPTLDGNFIGAGESLIEQPGEPSKRSGWLMKFSPNGDSIWSRHDLSLLLYELSNSHFFGGVGTLSSGNIVAGGSASEGNKKYIWLVKVTPDGCLDTLFCGLVDVKNVSRQTTDLRVYPNPANEEITVEMAAGFPAAQAVLHNLSGRQVRRLEVPQGSTQFKMPVAHLAAGIYFLELGFEDGRFLRRKVVVGK